MARKELLREVDGIKAFVKENNINEEVLKELADYTFKPRPRQSGSGRSRRRSSYFQVAVQTAHSVLNFVNLILKVFLILMLLYALLSCHSPTQKIILKYSQSLIYPVMRGVRLITLPVLRFCPSLTAWHHEECLVNNPFYQGEVLECWPCENVRTLVDLTGLEDQYIHGYVHVTKPFTVKDALPSEVTLTSLQQLISNNEQDIQVGTIAFESSSEIFKVPSDIEQLDDADGIEKPDFHILWKTNHVASARALRKMFPRPYFTPVNSEVSLQKFLFIDGPEAVPYQLPLTEFANVWLAQGQGYRLILLNPSEPCQKNCSALSILLKPKDVLYYNWQYWRPLSLPARLNATSSITFMGSFY